MGTPGSLWGWALQGVSALQLADSGVGHSNEALRLGNSGRLWGWALQESLGWALQGDSGVGHSRESSGRIWFGHSRRHWVGHSGTLWLGTPGSLLSLKSYNPTPSGVL